MSTPTMTNQYRTQSLHELCSRIAESGDRETLDEFHNSRSVFSIHEYRNILFIEYVRHLREAASSQSWGYLVAERAFDKTVDKFTNTTDRNAAGGTRRYFQAALEYCQPASQSSELVTEGRIAETLQRIVYRQFMYSLRDCQRSGEMTRYVWELVGGSIQIRLPRSLSGSARRRWLEQNIPNPNPNRTNERMRVQELIDQHFCASKVSADAADPLLVDSDLPSTNVDRICSLGLAKTVAEEKGDRLLEQRPAIRSLGSEKLKELICEVFDRIASGECRDVAVAGEFGISKAALSRFAGSRWRSSSNGTPDLWRNCAQLIASNPAWLEAVSHFVGKNRIVAVART